MMKVFEKLFPTEIVNIIMQHHSAPSADVMRCVIKTYNQNNQDLTFYDVWRNTMLESHQVKIAMLESEYNRQRLRRFIDDEEDEDGDDDEEDEDGDDDYY